MAWACEPALFWLAIAVSWCWCGVRLLTAGLCSWGDVWVQLGVPLKTSTVRSRACFRHCHQWGERPLARCSSRKRAFLSMLDKQHSAFEKCWRTERILYENYACLMTGTAMLICMCVLYCTKMLRRHVTHKVAHILASWLSCTVQTKRTSSRPAVVCLAGIYLFWGYPYEAFT